MPENNIKFEVILKLILLEGNLAWEYNPFRNYRLSEDMIYYKGRFYTKKEFKKEFFSLKADLSEELPKVEEVVLRSPPHIDVPEFIDINTIISDDLPENWRDSFLDLEEQPILYQKGLMVDFITKELDFDINHPVLMLPSYSYDDSVDIILNDGKSKPKIINSRFSALGNNRYKIYDRLGENDTNLYSSGSEFLCDTSLYKYIHEIASVTFLGESYGGNLKIGGYHFYFKYIDADGNKSDFFAESGLVLVFLGGYLTSVHSGFSNENSHKLVRFMLANLDHSYEEIVVYYSRYTSEENQSMTSNTYEILDHFLIKDHDLNIIDITGFENTIEIPSAELNKKFLYYSNALAHEVCLNRLFLGNVQKPEEDLEFLTNVALKIIPKVNISLTCKVNALSNLYDGDITNTYYNPSFTYNNTGYWDDEIYRFGVVFIKNDNTLTSVYNVRGGHLGKELAPGDWYKNDDKIEMDTINNIVLDDKKKAFSEVDNTLGVCYIPKTSINNVIGIEFWISDKTKEILKERGFKGYMFVRLRRIPTTLCQAYMMGVDPYSHTPLLFNGNAYSTESFLNKDLENKGHENEGYRLSHSYDSHLRILNKNSISLLGAICPDYDINSPFYNSLFTGNEFVIRDDGTFEVSQSNRYFSYKPNDESDAPAYYNVKILGVEDNVKLVAINDTLFAARAGEAEEAYKVLNLKSKNTLGNGGNNLLRGSYGPYLGITGLESFTEPHLITIKIPGYSPNKLSTLFKIRYNDNAAYYSISNFILLDNSEKPVCYRGDCYICRVAHRFNRNFSDPSAPSNDTIVNPLCWAENYKYEDNVLKSENLNKINLGDVNAVQLGIWVDMLVRSSINLSIRSLDGSFVDEEALMGSKRGFYPYYSIRPEGSYKIKEALCYNKGFEKSVSEKEYFKLPPAPVYSNNYTTRVAYSNVKVNSFFENSFRTFEDGNYRDYPMTYGAITKLIELDGDLICVFEHGVGVLSVNERVISGDGTGGPVYINTLNILPEAPFMLSDTFGSLWKESIIKTPKAIYGVDTVGKKIWRCTKSNFEVISDFSVLKFLNDNISLTERESTPIIGIRNVKTHYNANKGDVMFTFYDNLHGFEEKAWNLCWNELLNIWVTFYSWIPSYSENIYNLLFSFDRNTSKYIAKLGISNTGNNFSDGVTLNDNILRSTGLKFELELSNRFIQGGDNLDITYDVTFELERDNLGNWKNFKISDDGKSLIFTGNYDEVCSEFYQRIPKNFYLPSTNSFTTDTNLIIASPSNTKDYVAVQLPEGDIRILFNLVDHPEYQGLMITVFGNITKKYCGITGITNTSEVLIGSTFDNNGDGLSWNSPYTVTLLQTSDNLNTEGVWVAGLIVGVMNPIEDTLFTEEAAKDYFNGKWDTNYLDNWKKSLTEGALKIYKDDRGRRLWINREYQINPDKLVIYLNVRAKVDMSIRSESTPLLEAIVTKLTDRTKVNAGYYESVIAIIPEYNQQFLTTNFWKHGRAGIIDVADKIYPTYWYGKLHPFEFEFVVSDSPESHKIFDSLEIISNNAAPESFHYEIVGDCYEFAKDKKNMYIRQEATKELYLYNGSDICFDPHYKELQSVHRPLTLGDKDPKLFDKSTIFPAYYRRLDTINDIEDYYHLYKDDGTKGNKNFSALAGAELVRYEDLDEYHIWNHAKAVDVAEEGLSRGNMLYKEDIWNVQINPINIVQKNESKEDWENKYRFENDKLDYSQVPAELNLFKDQSDIPENRQSGLLQLPPEWTRNVVSWSDYQKTNKEAKVKDKFIKIRIRYSGKDLAIISAIRTLYSISYA